MFKNKILMITGGTGSFGKAILKRFLSTDIGEIRIFSRDEKKQDDLRRKLNNDKLKFYIGDVRDYNSVNEAMKNVNFVFHAAALKQVPSCEFYPLEAIKTNILGAENVMNSAVANGVERVVVLSTDKSVYPINAMGMSKALMEKCMISKARMQDKGGTIFCATRYGNVMASRGSVIPLFVSQLKNNEDLTVTDPNMTRFLMSLDESVDLVLYAYKHGEQGSIYVQKSPSSTINDLAHALIKIFNKKSQIKLIGTRLGEKLYETLISREEMSRAVDLGEYYSIPYDNKNLNYSKYFSEGEEAISTYKDYTSHNTKRLNVEETKELLQSLDYIKDNL
jgi:UDP-N-acetylglucosamine 4,6-dehydratase